MPSACELASLPPVGTDMPDLGVTLVSRAASILNRELTALSKAIGSAAPPNPAESLERGLPMREAEHREMVVPADRLRLQAQEILEALLGAINAKEPPSEDRVPLLRCLAPVSAGGGSSAIIRVSNEEAFAVEANLYCSNFISDTGYDVPSSCATFSPRTATIPPKGEAKFELNVAVPSQAPAGIYSGLVQATGTKYVKAVVSIEVK